MIRRILISIAAALPAFSFAAFPERQITLMQGFAAGGNADVIARIVAAGLAKELGQPVVVEAKLGAGGNVASGMVAKANADGYTLILLTGGHAVSGAVYKKLPFDPVEDFDWLSVVSKFPFVISVNSASKFNNLRDVIAVAKAAPDTVSYSSVGVGSTQHLSGELFQAMSGTKLIHIPYKGGSGPIQDVLGGRVDLMFDSVTVTRAQVEGGRLRALGVTSAQPVPLLPGVAPVADTVPGFEVTSWTGIAAPKGLPPAIAQRLHAALIAALADPETRQRLEATGGSVTPSASGAEMKSYVANQVSKWKKVVTDSAIPQQ
jgi:tripartite-type tricarboxylate transporter receptor subunit TctC